MQQYRLRNHVHLCVQDDVAVILDVKRDRYLGLDAVQLRAFMDLVSDVPDDAPQLRETVAGLSEWLERENILSRSDIDVKRLQPVLLDVADERLVDQEAISNTQVGAQEVTYFLAACTATAIYRRVATFEHMLRRIEDRKMSKRNASLSFDLDRARRLTGAFCRIRPFLYTKRDHCLFDSLALMEFLARWNLYPTLVVGVKPRPFMAHMWVQHERYVLNGTPGFVQMFTPILAI